MAQVNPVERVAEWLLAPVVRWAGRRVERRVQAHVEEHARVVDAALPDLPDLPEPPVWSVPVVVVISFVAAVVAERFSDPDHERTERERAEPEPEATAERGTTSATDEGADEEADETPVEDALEVLMGEPHPAADRSEVKSAYRSLAVETHPDQGGEAARFIEVRKAWETLEEEGLSGDGPDERGN